MFLTDLYPVAQLKYTLLYAMLIVKGFIHHSFIHVCLYTFLSSISVL